MQKIINFLKELIAAMRAAGQPRPVLSVVPKPPGPEKVFGPTWYVKAYREIGVKEYEIGDNGRIIEYHSATRLAAKDQKTPWCASFVCWCLEKSGYVSTNSAWAKDYLRWGVKLDEPRFGCVVILTRGAVSGHVGFFVGETDEKIVLLSGNTANSVCISSFPKSRVLGYRWPNGSR